MRKKTSGTEEGGEAETSTEIGNQTDNEKNVLRKTAALIEVSKRNTIIEKHITVAVRYCSLYLQDLKRMCLAPMSPSQPSPPQPEPEAAAPSKPPPPAEKSPREQLSNNMARILEMQRRTNEVSGHVCMQRPVYVCVRTTISKGPIQFGPLDFFIVEMSVWSCSLLCAAERGRHQTSGQSVFRRSHCPPHIFQVTSIHQGVWSTRYRCSL